MPPWSSMRLTQTVATNPLVTHMISILTSVLVTLLPVSVQPATQPLAPFVQAVPEVEDNFEQRLARVTEELDKKRIANHIPGMALAVVKDDKVVLTRGFGLADVQTGRVVDGETLFAIGSTTKAFTAALAGILQDEGKLDFDDPVTKYLPYFELNLEGPDSEGDATVTLRDLMSHRTGFTRMSMLWVGGEVPREKLLRTAVNAEPWTGFRESFHYNNVMFLAAGVATGAAAGADWDELMHKRIFGPLGMDSTNLSTTKAQANEHLALGYEWNEDKLEYTHKIMRDLVAIAPAGAINSNANDMAQWIRLQLGRGEIDGERLISEQALVETWAPNIAINDSMDYGLGWMLREQSGTRVVEHGGNIDGFAAQVTLFPDENLGYVLLMNTTMSSLQQESVGIAIDALLAATKDDVAAPLEFDDYIGNFTANFGPFSDAIFEVLVQNDHLSVDVPGQMVYELNSPDEEGKWFFRLTDTIAVSFDRGDDGSVHTLNMYQSGMKFEMLREGASIPMEAPLADFEKFLGTYLLAELDEEVHVIIQNGRLAFDIPSQMVFELHLPDSEGKRAFRVSDEMALRFNEDESGKVTSITMYEGGDTGELPRIDDSGVEAAPLPTLDELFALRGTNGPAQLLREHGSIRSTGTIQFVHAGITGDFDLIERFDPPAFRLEMDLGAFGTIDMGTGDGTTWSYQSAVGYSELSGLQAQQIARRTTAIIQGDWRENFDSVKITGVEEWRGRDVIAVELKFQELPAFEMLVDSKTGELLRTKTTMIAGEARLPVTTFPSNYKMLEGANVNYEITEENASTGQSVLKTKRVQLGVELAPDFHVWREKK
jgi:CubicO group peptidase (beta-lactamase class C family)